MSRDKVNTEYIYWHIWLVRLRISLKLTKRHQFCSQQHHVQVRELTAACWETFKKQKLKTVMIVGLKLIVGLKQNCYDSEAQTDSGA